MEYTHEYVYQLLLKALLIYFLLLTSVFQTIIEDSVLNQQAYLQTLANPNIQEPTVSVAFLGDKGSYSYLASHRYFSRRAEKIIESTGKQACYSRISYG